MNKEHRLILEMERDMLSKVKLDDLEPFLKKYKIFNKYMWGDIETTEAMLDELPHRGPTAFQNIIEILKNAKYYEEANKLEGHTLAKKVDKNLYYILSTTPLGYCLIINNSDFESEKLLNRDEKDGDSLRDILETIGFHVTIERNKKAIEMDDLLKEFSRKNFTNVHSAMIIILSHGSQKNNKDFIYGVDGKYIYKSDIRNYFNNKVCPQLQNKPRVFFFVCCRNSREDITQSFDYGAPVVCLPDKSTDNLEVMPTLKDILVHSTLPVQVSVSDENGSSLPDESIDNLDVMPTLKDMHVSVSDENGSCLPDERIDGLEVMPTFKDILVVHSTLPMQVSVSDENGSYFCQEFIIILKEHYRTYDLQTMINLVNTKLEKRISRTYRNFQLAHTEALGGTKRFMFCKTCS